MAEKKEASSENSAPAGAASGGGSKLPMILGAVNLVLTLGLVAVVFLGFKKENQKQTVEDIVANAEGEHGGAPAGEGGAPAGGHGAAASVDNKDPKSSGSGSMITLEEFTVNLATAGTVNPKFARIHITIEVQNDDTKVELVSKMPQVRNTVIDLFNSKRPSDLSTVDGRNFVKDEIKNAINGFLITGKVKGIYFTSFTIGS
jgi:flagellar basal body-associated protein FliL